MFSTYYVYLIIGYNWAPFQIRYLYKNVQLSVPTRKEESTLVLQSRYSTRIVQARRNSPQWLRGVDLNLGIALSSLTLEIRPYVRVSSRTRSHRFSDQPHSARVDLFDRRSKLRGCSEPNGVTNHNVRICTVFIHLLLFIIIC